jgi:arylsulfatase A-like enzyme
VVTSDHGSSSITRRVQPAHDLAALLAGGAVAENGGSVFVYTSDPGAVSAIRTLDYAGPIFTRDGRDQTFPLALVGLDGPRAPDIVFSLSWSESSVKGVPGAAVGTNSKLAVDHGTISPFELRNTLVCQGLDFRAGWRDPAPVGNIDIAPTLTQILRLEPGTAFEGRVLEEALRDAPADTPRWERRDESTAFTARGSAFSQHIWFECVDAHQYLAGGSVDRA